MSGQVLDPFEVRRSSINVESIQSTSTAPSYSAPPSYRNIQEDRLLEDPFADNNDEPEDQELVNSTSIRSMTPHVSEVTEEEPSESGKILYYLLDTINLSNPMMNVGDYIR